MSRDRATALQPGDRVRLHLKKKEKNDTFDKELLFKLCLCDLKSHRHKKSFLFCFLLQITINIDAKIQTVIISNAGENVNTNSHALLVGI